MIRTAAYLLMLALLSAGAILVGYVNTSFGWSRLTVQLVYEEIPVGKATLFLILAFLFNTMLAFFTSRGRFEDFKVGLFALSFIVPFAVAIVVLPDAIETPGHLGSNYSLMLFGLTGSQIIVGWLLAEELWRFGGGDIGDHRVTVQSMRSSNCSAKSQKVLEHLSYIIEAVASDLIGEAKFELDRLIERVQTSGIDNESFILENLSNAKHCLKDGNTRHAAADLSRVSRSLWKQLVSQDSDII